MKKVNIANITKVVLIVSLFFSILSFSLNIEKVYIGIKYSFRIFKTDGEVIFVDPFSRKMILFNLYSRQVLNFLNNVGKFAVGAYKLENGYLIVDRVDPSVQRISDFGERIFRINLSKRVQGNILNGNRLYILLEGGEFEEFEIRENELRRISTYKFEGSPSYIFLWKDKIFATYLWNDERDIQFLGENPKELGLTTPSLLIEDILIDTRGGKVYNLNTNKITALAPYISSGYYDPVENIYYIASMSNFSVYLIKDDKIISSFKVPFTPTNISKINNSIVILSAPYNKVMITSDGKNILTLDTGDYPLEIFKIDKLSGNPNAFAVYCSDSGEIYYYYF